MKVRDFMQLDFVTLRPDEKIKRVNQLLKQNLKFVLVTNKENEVEGIITFSDLFRHLLPSYIDFLVHTEANILFPENVEKRALELVNKHAKEIMTKEPETVHPNLPLVEVGIFMLANKTIIPVIEKGKLVGVISYTDITWGLMMKSCKCF